jgi:nicotinamidase/pyrazinamidase
MKYLIVVDMQNDFIDGALGTPEAKKIVEKAVDKIKNFDGKVLFTQDTHDDNYLKTQEGKNLPVVHCIKGTPGWEIRKEIAEAAEGVDSFEKVTFGSIELAEYLANKQIDSIELIGICTDICVISNALLLKAYFPEVPIVVDASCCAGVTPESHQNALAAMKVCQIEVRE